MATAASESAGLREVVDVPGVPAHLHVRLRDGTTVLADHLLPGMQLTSGARVLAAVMVRCENIHVLEFAPGIWLPRCIWMRRVGEEVFHGGRTWQERGIAPEGVHLFAESMVSVSTSGPSRYLELRDLPGWQVFVPSTHEVIESLLKR